jgi:hypothetical protein
MTYWDDAVVMVMLLELWKHSGSILFGTEALAIVYEGYGAKQGQFYIRIQVEVGCFP